MVPDVEPVFLPAHVASGELVLEVLLALFLLELKSCPTNHGLSFRGRLRAEAEEVAEEIEMGFNAKESFTEMDKNRNIDDGIRIQMMDLNPRVEKKGRERSQKRGGPDPCRQNVQK